MPVNFGFGFGFQNNNAQTNFAEIHKICEENHDCTQCPVYKDNGYHCKDNSVIICSKIEEKIKDNNNG